MKSLVRSTNGAAGKTTPILRVALQSEHDLVLARQRVRQVSSMLGLDRGATTRLATAVSEIARNAYQYGTDGTVELEIEWLQKPVLWAKIRDRGPGIDDPEAIFAGNYRSKTGLGLGFAGSRRLVDLFSVESEPGDTLVELGQVLPQALENAAVLGVVEELARTPPSDAFAEVLLQNQELLRAQQQLAEANRELATADRAKDRFLAMLGHELRNLLNALRSSLEVLGRSPAKTIRERMQNLALGQTDHLGRLVDDLLDASQISRGELEVRAIPLELKEELESFLETWRERVAEAGLELRHEWEQSEQYWVKADPTRLAQIVGNLLSNACKFTDPGGEICVSLSRVEERIRLEVSDNGCGMDSETLGRVFEPFVQAEEARRRMTGGLGLGLAIVQGLVKSHSGTLRAESEALGSGSRFIVELPSIEAPEEVVERPSPTTSVPALKILLVDDHRASAEGLAELLRLEGHEVEVALDGNTALDMAESFEPDIVLCDLGLPGIDGYEVARVLRGREDGKPSRLLALSGFADAASRQHALEAGFDAHLSKPINVDALLERLDPGTEE